MRRVYQCLSGAIPIALMVCLLTLVHHGCAGSLSRNFPERYNRYQLPDIEFKLIQQLVIEMPGGSILGKGILVKKESGFDTIALTSFGNKLFHIHLENGSITPVFTSRGLEQFSPDMIIRDLNLIFLLDPLVLTDEGQGDVYRAWGFSVKDVRDPSGNLQHRLIRNKKEKIKVDYSEYSEFGDALFPRVIQFRNQTAEYQIRIYNEQVTVTR